MCQWLCVKFILEQKIQNLHSGPSYHFRNLQYQMRLLVVPVTGESRLRKWSCSGAVGMDASLNYSLDRHA